MKSCISPKASSPADNSFSFSRRAVTNSLLDKLQSRVRQKTEPTTPGIKAADLEKRLSLLH